MSGYICGSEWAALFTTRRRRMTADKWIRSLTVTVASGELVHCVCVCVYVWISPHGSEWSLCMPWCWVDPWHYIHTHTHTSLCSYPVSANTTLICILSILPSFCECEIMMTSSWSVLISKEHQAWRSFTLQPVSVREVIIVTFWFWRFIWSVFLFAGNIVSFLFCGLIPLCKVVF